MKVSEKEIKSLVLWLHTSKTKKQDLAKKLGIKNSQISKLIKQKTIAQEHFNNLKKIMSQ